MTANRSNARFLALLIALLAFTTHGFLPSIAMAQDDEHAKISAVGVSMTAVKPGEQAMVAVVLNINAGLHAQSNTPSMPEYYKFRAKVEANDAIQVGPPVFPVGEDKEYPELGKLNVYTGKVIVRFPITIPKDAKPGDLLIKGTLGYQTCDDKLCFPPDKTPFEIPVKVVEATETTKPANEALFKDDKAPPTTKPTTAPADITPAKADQSLLYSFGLAFVVGLLFNVVPCVLPVLPLKAIGFYETAQHNRAKSVSYGLVFSLGILASFAVLGLLVVVLRVIAWGELFSNQYFSLALVIILVAMAAQMFGLFNVNLPTGVYAFSPRHDTYFGNFLYGILTAALSTPCTFGYFVSVLTIALVQPAIIGLSLIIVVGMGMAFPFLVLSALPEVARKFPRTGPWSELVKQFMAFMLLAVAIFFAQVWIARLTDPHNVWWIIFAVIAAGALFLVGKCFKYGKTRTAPTVGIVLAILIIAPSLYAARLLTIRPYQWQAYSETALAEAKAKNGVVLIDFTATWCATCHTVEAVVLNNKAVQAAVQKYNVKMIKADLTEDDAAGWKLLKGDLKAEGIPLTAIYSPSLDQPIRLPGIYSVDDLERALERASAKPTALR